MTPRSISLLLLLQVALIVPLAAQQASSATTDTLLHYDLPEVSVLQKLPPIKYSTGSTLELLPAQLQRLPQLLSTPDYFRTLQLMSGVQTTGDLSTGVYVQGCEPSHTLIQLAGATLYNPVHLLGFIPVLNSDHVDQFVLEKGCISPQYEGRLASVVTISPPTQQPEQREWGVQLGLLTSSLSLRTPTSPKSNLYLSARLSHVNPMLQLIEKMDDHSRFGMSYQMSDINLTWNYRPDEDNLLTLNGYYGTDKMGLVSKLYLLEADISWCNATTSAVWRHKISDHSHVESTLYGSHFHDKIALDQRLVYIDMQSRLEEVGAKSVYHLNPTPRCAITLGGECIDRTLHPQQIETSIFATSPQWAIRQLEWALFANWREQLTPTLGLSAGVRYAGVWGLSAAPEPRLALSFEPTSRLSTTLSYTRQRQYIGMALVSGTALPTNYFIAAMEGVPPQQSDNLSIDYSYRMANYRWQLSGMVYYRKLKQQYENNTLMTDLLKGNTPFTSRFARGDGENYGIETMLKYHDGNYTGWVAYTLAWALRTFPSLNEGLPFYASNDRRHDLSLVAMYTLTPQWSLSGALLFATGTPTTLPLGTYTIGGYTSTLYSEKNGGRMPPYHRLDISATRTLHLPWFKSSALTLSLYNVYARSNALFYYNRIVVKSDEGTFSIVPTSTALFTLLPSLSFTCKF